MDLHELRKMTVPKLKERAKEIPDLQGVGGMKKDELIGAIAKAEGFALEAGTKDLGTIRSIKEQVRTLQKKKADLQTSPPDRSNGARLRKRIRKLKRQTRLIANEAARQKAVQQAQTVAAAAAAEAKTKAAEAKVKAAAAAAEAEAKAAAESAPAESPAPAGEAAVEVGPTGE